MTRRLIKKAIKKNVTVEQDTHYRYVGELVELLEKSYKRWAEQQHEPIWLTWLRRQDNLKEDKFKALIDSIGAGCRIWIARLNGKPAAAALNLNHGNVVNVLMPMDKAVAGNSGAVDMLRNEMLKDACEKKKRYFNLGESGPSASLSFYKERVGGIAYHYCEFIYERIPLTRIDRLVRSMVKKMIGFKDTKDFSYGKNKKTSGLHQVIGK
jgi:hypothetical protein